MKAEDILMQVAELKRRKSEDYQGSAWTEDDYFPFGHHSFLQMLHTKYLRMRSVVEQDNQNFESLADTLRDMIAYAAMYAAWLERNEKTFSNPDTSGNSNPDMPETGSSDELDVLRGRSPRNSVSYRDLKNV